MTLWSAAYQVPRSLAFSRQERWSGQPFPSPSYLPDLGIEPGSPTLQVDFLTPEPPEKPGITSMYTLFYIVIVMLLLRHFSRVQPQRRQPTRLPHPWDSPGKSTGVGCHFFLQCMEVKSESEVTQLCPTPSNSTNCSPPGPSVHGILQARVLEWGAIAFSE